MDAHCTSDERGHDAEEQQIAILEFRKGEESNRRERTHFVELADVKVPFEALPLLQFGIDGQPLHGTQNPANGIDCLHPVVEPLDMETEPVVGDGVVVVLPRT